MLLAVDPGKREAGWAWFSEEGRFLHCGLARAGKGPLWVCVDEITSAIHKSTPGRCGELVIEKPRIYRQRKWKGDPKDQIDLAIMVGALIRDTRARDCQLPSPHDWKGNVPKTRLIADYVIHNRNLKTLNENERSAYGAGLKTAPAGLCHNIVDAVGIGLWAVAPRRTA